MATQRKFDVISQTNAHFAPRTSVLIILTLLRVLRTSVAMKHCNSRLVFFISRHSHSYNSTTLYLLLRMYSVLAFVSSRSSAMGFFHFSLKSLPWLSKQSWPCQQHPCNWYTVCVSTWKPSRGSFRSPMCFCVVQQVVDMNSVFMSYPFEPLNRHLYRIFRFQVVFCQALCVTSRWHILHNSPEVQSSSIISHDLRPDLSLLLWSLFWLLHGSNGRWLKGLRCCCLWSSDTGHCWLGRTD